MVTRDSLISCTSKSDLQILDWLPGLVTMNHELVSGRVAAYGGSEFYFLKEISDLLFHLYILSLITEINSNNRNTSNYVNAS